MFLLNVTLGRLSNRGGSRAAATAKMERFVIIVLTKHFVLDATAALDLSPSPRS